MRLLSLAAAALAALLLTITLANAQEPPGSESGTRLEPGVNLVGWVGEPTSVSQLFREIPELEAIWAWDAELDDWVVAGRGAPEWLGGLGRVTAGMGLRLVLGGEEPFVWQRSTEPTRGLVELRTGWNLVGWSGTNGASLEQVAKGIGWSLREVRRWDAVNQRWEVWMSPERSAQLIATDQAAPDEEAEPVTVRRGEALWIKVARAVNWLQPTGVLPRLVFPGGASDELRARVREDLESVLAFYGQRYGIQADPDFTVYVAKDVGALIQAYRDESDRIVPVDAANIRALWNRVGGWADVWNRLGRWADESIVVKQASWSEDLSTSEIAWGRYLLTHEYFHILQGQLSDGWAGQSWIEWLVEGTANWAEGEHQVLDGEQTLQDLREREQSDLSSRTPTLRSTESSNDQWEYTLGWLAIDQLVASAGSDSWIELWRQLAATDVGPHGRWMSTPDWRTAFQETIGVPVSSFYADFDAWQREQAAANGSVASSSNDDTHWIRGRITNESGAPISGAFVNAIRVEGGIEVGWNQRAETNTGGVFAVRVPEDGDYHISVDIDDNCATRYYYSNGKLSRTFIGYSPVTVTGSDVRNIELQVPANICSWFIRGRITTDAGQPLESVSVSACEVIYDRPPLCTNGHTASDGSFAVPVATAGEYHLGLNLADGCSFYYYAGNAMGRQAQVSTTVGSSIHISNADSPHLLVRVPEGVCAYQIRGRFTKSDGQPLADVEITACREVDAHCIEQNTDVGGAFAITVPTEDRYRLSFRDNDCYGYFGQGQLAINRHDAQLVEVEGQGVQLTLQAPTTLCRLQISGQLVSATGARLVSVTGAPLDYVYACHEVDYTICFRGPHNTDGSFAITVPIDGRYRVHFYHRDRGGAGCYAYFGRGQLTANRDDAWLIDVAGQDVRLRQRQVPTRGVCSPYIAGRLVDAAGNPVVGVKITTTGSSGPGEDWTDENGRFEISVYSSSTYTFAVGSYCWYAFRGEELGSRDNPVRVSEADVTGVELRLPGTIEELCE